MRKMLFYFACIALLGLAVALAEGPVVVLPYQSTLTLPEGKYGVQLCQGKCMGLAGVQKDGKMTAVLMDVDGSSSCQTANGVGMIKVASNIPAYAQRHVLIHEVVHIAAVCDQRQKSLEEKIAEDVSALYDDQYFHSFMTAGGK